ncbi:MAG: hypothetical protein IKW76_13155 [Clostridia bacterium]|nr:hypothetical protein [Clostridia bacterium]
MRPYTRPELYIEAFDVEDVITASGLASPDIGNNVEGNQNNGAASPMAEEMTETVEKTTLFPESTVANPSGAFQQEITGGNIVQEGLNNLYENFLNRF